MRDKLKKLALVFMALCLLATAAAPAEVKAADGTALDKTKVTLQRVGDKAELILDHIAWGKTITWSSSNEAVVSVRETVYSGRAVIGNSENYGDIR